MKILLKPSRLSDKVSSKGLNEEDTHKLILAQLANIKVYQ